MKYLNSNTSNSVITMSVEMEGQTVECKKYLSEENPKWIYFGFEAPEDKQAELDELYNQNK